MVHGDHVDGIGYQRPRHLALPGPLLDHGQAEFGAESRQLVFQFGQRIPAAGDQHDDGELAAQQGHTGFLDVAAGIEYAAGEVLYQPYPVIAGGGNNQVFVQIGGVHVGLPVPFSQYSV